MNKNNITLPVFETAKRSFMYIIKNFSSFAKICSIFMLLVIAEIFLDFPSLCYINSNYCRQDISSNITALIISLSGIIVSVEIIRNIILKQDYKWFSISFGKPHIRYIGYSLLIGAMIIIPALLILSIVNTTNQADVSAYILVFLKTAFLATIIGLTAFCFRLYLVFAGAAIGDAEMTLYKSYLLTSGNMLRIICGQFLLAIPTIILVVTLVNLYQLSEWGLFGNSVFVLLGLICSYFDIAVKASYYSHIYQYFIFSSKQ